MRSTLYYIHDPMCSWCWGHRPVWDEVKASLPDSVHVEYVAAGLAPETDEPMPEELQQTIQGYWRKIQGLLGTEFNFDFWTKNTPRRSTYPACRAVIAAKNQGCEKAMIDAIQRAYYLRALNPSDDVTLMQLAWELYSQELGVDVDQFALELNSGATHQELERQIALARELTHEGYPSMVLEVAGEHYPIARDYQNAQPPLEQITAILDNA